MDLSDLGLQQEPPELARLEVHQFRWRIGKLFNMEGGFEGVKIEVYLTALPWFKIHLPFTRLEMANFIRGLQETVEEGVEFERGMDGDNPETETTS